MRRKTYVQYESCKSELVVLSEVLQVRNQINWLKDFFLNFIVCFGCPT